LLFRGPGAGRGIKKRPANRGPKGVDKKKHHFLRWGTKKHRKVEIKKVKPKGKKNKGGEQGSRQVDSMNFRTRYVIKRTCHSRRKLGMGWSSGWRKVRKEKGLLGWCASKKWAT